MVACDPMIVAHRGLAGHAPENTMVAYGVALELGFGLEVDLSLTADDQIVMIHDRSLERTTNGQGPVGETSLLELQALDAGSWFHPSFSDQRIPTLAETLGFAQERRRIPTLIALDVRPSERPLEGDICQLVERYGLVEEVLAIGMTTHTPDVRRRFKEADPRFLTAIVTEAEEWDEAIADDSADWLYTHIIPTEQQASAAHKAGKRLFAARPRLKGIEPDAWRALHNVGVDAILCDYPLECRRALQAQKRS